MQSLLVAKAQLSKMPADVFDQWLIEVVEQRGWPFGKVDAVKLPPEWHAFLLGRPISYWSALNWELRDMRFEDANFEFESLQKAACILKEVTTGIRIFRHPIERSAARLASCLKYIAENGRPPRPLICIDDPSGIRPLIDGHHRVAALMALRPDDLLDFVVPVWIGRLGHGVSDAA